MNIPSIILDNSVTVMVNGKTLVARVSHPNFEAIKATLKKPIGDVSALAAMFDIPAAISATTNGLVTIRGDKVFYQGTEINSTLTARMVQMLSEGFNITPLINFLQKLMQNPSNRAVTGLYDFLAATSIPITPDGNFLAYKKVRGSYFDIHSNTIRNAVGDTPRVPRNAVVEDPDRTCASGLHVCSESYLAHFSSSGSDDRVVICEIDPADVVAIPRDYNNAKMRVSGYKVVGEVALDKTKGAFNSSVMSAASFTASDWSDFDDDAELDFVEDETIRDIHGVFVTLTRDGDGEWVASFEDEDGIEEVYFTGLDGDIEEAVSEFRETMMEEVETYTATAVWLDDDGDRCSEMVAIETAYGEPHDSDFADEVEDDSFDHAAYRVTDITKTGSRWKLAS